MSYFLDEILDMSIKDIKKTGKTKAEHFMLKAEYCELNWLIEEHREYYQECRSPLRTILMFSDGSALQIKNGQFTII